MKQLLFKGTFHSSCDRKMNKTFLFLLRIKATEFQEKDNTGAPCFVQQMSPQKAVFKENGYRSKFISNAIGR